MPECRIERNRRSAKTRSADNHLASGPGIIYNHNEQDSREKKNMLRVRSLSIHGRLFGPICMGLFSLLLSTAGTASSRPDQAGIAKWREDIEQLALELPRRHKDLFHQRSEAEFLADIRDLNAGLESRSESEILFALSCIVASFGDAHTQLGYRPRVAFPLSFYWFKEGIYCIAAFPEYKTALDSRLLEIDHQPVEDVVAELSRAFPFENRSQLKKSVVGYLVFAEMLHGAGIIADPQEAVFTLENSAGDRFDLTCPAVAFSSNKRPVSTARAAPLPLYRRLADQDYAYEYLKPERTLYLAYNACRQTRGRPFSAFVKEVFAIVDSNPVDRFVIDLRRNGGGNSAVFEPLIAELERRKDLLRKDRLFVIIGRRTFSSAVLNAIQLKNRTQAVFVGEPSGGKPNHFGEVKTFQLKNSRLSVSYSTKYFTMWKQGGDALDPDIPVDMSIRDFMNNSDPVLDRILKSRAEGR